MSAQVPPGGPLKLTTGRWSNKRKVVKGLDGEPGERWAKKLAHTGPLSQFKYGTDTPAEQWTRGFLQKCIICTPQTGVLVVDTDYPELFAATRTARLIGRAQAMSTRGDRYHVLADARPFAFTGLWPPKVPIAGADIISNLWVPVPGSWHWSEVRYEPVLHPGGRLHIVTGTPQLLAAIIADQADEKARRDAERASLGLPPARHGGNGGNGHDGEVSAACMGMIVKRLRAGWQPGPELKEDAYAEWLTVAIPHDPSDPFDREDFDRHYGDERQGGLEEALRIIADEATWMPGLMAWAEEVTRQARAQGRPARKPGARKPGRRA